MTVFLAQPVADKYGNLLAYVPMWPTPDICMKCLKRICECKPKPGGTGPYGGSDQ